MGTDNIKELQIGQSFAKEINFPPGFPQMREYPRAIIIQLGDKGWRPDCTHGFTVPKSTQSELMADGKFKQRYPTLRELDYLESALEKLNIDSERKQEMLSVLDYSRKKRTELILAVFSGEHSTLALESEQLIDIVEETLSGMPDLTVKPPVRVGREFCYTFRKFAEALLAGSSWSLTQGRNEGKSVRFIDKEEVSAEDVLPKNLSIFMRRYLGENRKAQEEYVAGFVGTPAWDAYLSERRARESQTGEDNDPWAYLRY